MSGWAGGEGRYRCGVYRYANLCSVRFFESSAERSWDGSRKETESEKGKWVS